MEAQVLEQDDLPPLAARVDRRLSPARRCSRRRTSTGRPSSSASRVGDRLQAELRVRLALRPAEVRREDRPSRPCSSAYLIVGSDARMRVSSAIAPFLSGTLKSTRMNTRLPGEIEILDRCVRQR